MAKKSYPRQLRAPLTVGTVIRAIFAVIITVIMAFPLFWMVSTALKTEAETMGAKLVFWPAKMQFQNFNYVIDSVPFFRYMINTAVVTAMQMASELILGIMAAYAFSKGRFHGKHFLFIVVLGAMMIPLQVTFIPLYIVIARVGLMNTYWGIWIAGCVSSYTIFLLRQAFMQVPKGLVEAARIDGGSHWKILWKVVCPITKSSFITFGLMNFISCYNNYMWPSLITDSDSKMMVSQGLRKFYIEGGAYGTEWALVMAGSTLIVLPLLILFAFTQKWFISGIGGDTGMKG